MTGETDEFDEVGRPQPRVVVFGQLRPTDRARLSLEFLIKRFNES
jgi:hypothetical protein